MKPRLPAWARCGAACLLLALILWLADWRSVVSAAASANPAWLAAGLASAILANMASAWRWHALTQWLGLRVDRTWAQVTYLQAQAISALMPGAVVGGDLYRAMALQRRARHPLEARLSVVLDRMSGLWMLVTLGALATAWGLAAGTTQWLVGLGWPRLSPLLCLGVGLLLLLSPLLALPMLRALAVPASHGATAGVAARLAAVAHRPGTAGQIGRQMFGSAVVQGLSIGALGCAGQALGIDQPYWVYAVAAVPTFVMATLPVSIGGWGSREAAAVLSLGAFGVSAAPAVAASLFYGVYALAQALVGAISLTARTGT